MSYFPYICTKPDAITLANLNTGKAASTKHAYTYNLE